MNKKIITSVIFLLSIGVALIPLFLFGINSIIDIIKKKEIVSFSYGLILTLSLPILSYFFIDISLRCIYFWVSKKQKTNKKYNIITILLTMWIFLSFPITWIGSYYLTSNNYQRCPSTNLFTQYYTTDLSLCPDPYYEERAGVKR
ncbi:DUF1240 domain-containing protein [Morganella morganii]